MGQFEGLPQRLRDRRKARGFPGEPVRAPAQHPAEHPAGATAPAWSRLQPQCLRLPVPKPGLSPKPGLPGQEPLPGARVGVGRERVCWHASACSALWPGDSASALCSRTEEGSQVSFVFSHKAYPHTGYSRKAPLEPNNLFFFCAVSASCGCCNKWLPPEMLMLQVLKS